VSLAAVFLDLGNTLLMERAERAAVYAEEAQRCGLEVDLETLRRLMTLAHAELPLEIEGEFRYSDAWFRAFQHRIFVHSLGLDPARFPELSERIFARFEAPQSFQLVPGSRELLRVLRERGLCIGLISNWSARLPRLLATLDLDGAFDFVLCSATERAEKPDPVIFRRALRLARATPDQSLHAGDQLERDAQGAQRVGIHPVLVDHFGELGASERSFCPVVGSLAELQDLILGLIA
jgi:putative hydrolase of the HAD superfamily